MKKMINLVLTFEIASVWRASAFSRFEGIAVIAHESGCHNSFKKKNLQNNKNGLATKLSMFCRKQLKGFPRSNQRLYGYIVDIGTINVIDVLDLLLIWNLCRALAVSWYLIKPQDCNQ